MLMFAARNAGPSLIPSPVIATIRWPVCSLHNVQLVDRTDSREDLRASRQSGKHLGREIRNLTSLEHPELIAVGKIELAGDRQGGGALIAGDHHCANAGSSKLFQRRQYARSDRIHHSNEANPDEVAFVAGIAAVLGNSNSEDA